MDIGLKILANTGPTREPMVTPSIDLSASSSDQSAEAAVGSSAVVAVCRSLLRNFSGIGGGDVIESSWYNVSGQMLK